MQALGLGKVSHNKQRQAMTPPLLIAMGAIDAVLNERCQSLVRQTPQTPKGRQGRQQSVSTPWCGLANEHNKSVVKVLWVT